MDATNKPVMLRVLSSAVRVASRAGAEVRKITKTGQLDVIDKGIQDYQTEADRTAQRMIVASLTSKFPKCIIVGEEDLAEDNEADKNLVVNDDDEDVLSNHTLPKQYNDVREEDITIWVDPLDGTAEFVKGFLEHVTILIGISINGKSIAGVIHQPFYGHSKSSPSKNITGRTIWGLVGLGCFGVEPMNREVNFDELIITTTASHGNKNIEEAIEALKPKQVLKVGGAGHKVLLVIEGRAHSYVFTSAGCKRWDTGAPEAVLESLGGKLTDVFGNYVDYSYRDDGNYQNYFGIIASINPEVHERIVKSIPIEIKNRLIVAKS